MARFAVGDRVAQAVFGHGTITAVNEYHTVIDFDEHGVRRFSTPLVRLERSTSAAPERKTKVKSRRSKS